MRRELPRPFCLLTVVALVLASCASPRERQAALVARAEAALGNGETRLAISSLSEALALDPRNLAVATRLAEVYNTTDLPGQALAVLSSLPADVTGDRRYRLAKLNALIRTCHLTEAANLASAIESDLPAALASDLLRAVGTNLAAAAIAPHLPERLRERLVRERIVAADLRTAAQILGKLDHGPDQQELLALWLEGVARSASLELVLEFPGLVSQPQTPAKLALYHRALVETGRWRAAAQAESDFTRLFPGEAPSYDMILAMARRRNRTGEPAAALRLIDRALSIDSRPAEAQVERGLALAALGRERESRQALRLALAEDPSNEVAARLLTGDRPPPQTVAIEVR